MRCRSRGCPTALYIYCDPILLLLVHALRFGLVEGDPPPRESSMQPCPATIVPYGGYMKTHDTSTHRPCPDGCQDGKLLTPETMTTHKKICHPIDKFPHMSCLILKCGSKHVFKRIREYEDHLRVQYQLVTVASRKLFYLDRISHLPILSTIRF